jgi:hypothetical protein
MSGSLFSLVALVLAWIFAGIGILHIIAPQALIAAYRKLGYPPAFPVVTGVFNIVAAVLLAYPEQRLLGVMLAALILFVANVTLLSQRYYLSALPGILLLMALPFAAATGLEAPKNVPYAIVESGPAERTP